MHDEYVVLLPLQEWERLWQHLERLEEALSLFEAVEDRLEQGGGLDEEAMAWLSRAIAKVVSVQEGLQTLLYTPVIGGQ